jgi:GT2 family glycosyltransferase
MTLSVIVVALGDDPRAAMALQSVQAERPEAELILVLNGVASSSVGWPAGTRVICNAENLGFAAAFNQGFAASRGEFVLALNPDARVLAGSVATALAALMADVRRGAVALRILRPDEKTLDSGGVRMNWLWRARDRGMGQPADGLYVVAEDVDAACMAAALFKRNALEQVCELGREVLDERFFAYKEDVDLGWRLRRMGFRVHYEPRALAVHERGWKEGARRAVPTWLRQMSFGNRWQYIAKNASPLAFLVRMPLLVAAEVLLLLWMLCCEPRTLGGVPRAVSLLPGSLRRRQRRAK